jgi:hypothetical protein
MTLPIPSIHASINDQPTNISCRCYCEEEEERRDGLLEDLIGLQLAHFANQYQWHMPNTYIHIVIHIPIQ